jgi:hypothetical protein
VQVLQAEVAGQELETERILAELAQLASEAGDYHSKRAYLEAVRSCKIIPLKTRESLPVCCLPRHDTQVLSSILSCLQSHLHHSDMLLT